MKMKRGIILSVLSSDSPTDSGNKIFLATIVSSVISIISLYLTITLKIDVGTLKTDVGKMKNDMNDLKYRFDAFGIGAAVSLGVFAGSGNIVKVLEYFDKKNDKVK